jgi:hypothetical protein
VKSALGDGLGNLPGWLASGAALSLGSNRQVARAWLQEMRWLEAEARADLHTLDALVFATDAPPFTQVWVAGRQVVAAGGSGARCARFGPR